MSPGSPWAKPRENAMCEPAGHQAGAKSSAGPEVSRRAPPPSEARTVQRPNPSRSTRLKTIRSPAEIPWGHARRCRGLGAVHRDRARPSPRSIPDRTELGCAKTRSLCQPRSKQRAELVAVRCRVSLASCDPSGSAVYRSLCVWLSAGSSRSTTSRPFRPGKAAPAGARKAPTRVAAVSSRAPRSRSRRVV